MAAEQPYPDDEAPFGDVDPPRDVRAEIDTWLSLQFNAYLHFTAEQQAEWDAWYQLVVIPDGAGLGLDMDDWPRWAEFIDMKFFWPYPWEPGTPASERPTIDNFYDDGHEDKKGRFTLYRLVGFDDRVLYIGVSRNIAARLRAHRRKWGPVIASVTTEEYPDVESMLEAEAAAIHDERPPLNVAGIV